MTWSAGILPAHPVGETPALRISAFPREMGTSKHDLLYLRIKTCREIVGAEKCVFFEKMVGRRTCDSSNPRNPERYDMGIVGKRK
jgi:hypothetical protein